MRKAPGSDPYRETFGYDGPDSNSVAGVLDYINYHDDILTADGRRTSRIGRECSGSLSCMEVCPMKIQTIASMARLNRAGAPAENKKKA